MHCTDAGSTVIRGAHGVGKPRQRAEIRAQPVQAISGWPDTALEKAMNALQHLQYLGRLAVRWARSQSYHLERWCAALRIFNLRIPSTLQYGQAPQT